MGIGIRARGGIFQFDGFDDERMDDTILVLFSEDFLTQKEAAATETRTDGEESKVHMAYVRAYACM